MIRTLISRLRLAAIAVGALMTAQPAQAAIYDVTMGGQLTDIRFGSFGALPSAVSPYLQPGDPFSASFTLDVSGNTINSITGTMDFDGAVGAVTSFSSSSGGTGYRGFSLRFDELATGLGTVGGVSIDDLSFRMAAAAGATVEDIFDAALSNGAAIYRAAVVTTYRSAAGSYSNYYAVFDNDGALSTQSVEISAVPLPPGLLLMLSGLAGFAFLLRRRST